MARLASVERSSDHELVRLIAERDGEAFTVFYRRYLPRVLAYLVRETRDRESAADLAAEVFAAVLLAASRYQSEGVDASAWVFSIARHKLSSSRRRGRVRPKPDAGLAMSPWCSRSAT